MTRARMHAWASVVGVLVQCGTIALYLLLLFFNPYAPLQRSPDFSGPLAAAAIQICLALAGAGFALWGKPVWMLVVGTLQCIPVGLYLAGTPGLFRWIGMANIGFVLLSMIEMVWFKHDRQSG